MYEVIRKYIKKSSLLERVALNVYEAIPHDVRNRFLLDPSFVYWTKLLKESEGWDLGRIRDFQFDQMKNLLVHSAKNVPHYRKLFSEIGFHPEKTSDFNDFRKIPFLLRKDVNEASVSMVDERLTLSALLRKSTSGSSGIPLLVYGDRAARAAFLAFRTSILGRAGYVPGAKEVMFWPMVSLGRRKSLPYMRYGNKLVLSIRHLTPYWLHRFVRMMIDFDPEWIMGYPSVLAVISSYIRDEQQVAFSRLRSVICYSETLYPWQRTLIEETFGARVFSMYSMIESVVIGGECELTDMMHLHPLYGYSECVDSGEGYKEIVATGLTSGVMPLIRYRTGDVVSGSDDSCPSCGRCHPVTDSLQGRINDFLVGRDGEIIPRLMPWLKTFPHVRQFRFDQEVPGKATLLISRGEGYRDANTEQIRLWVGDMLGILKDTISIEIEFVDEIHPLPSGKTMKVSQKLDIRDFLRQRRKVE
jgi:phenylacetate-CoA ligase